MKKKPLISALAAAVLSLSLLPAAAAASPVGIQEMGQVLAALDIMTGNENGDLMLSRQVTRAEFTKLVVAASPLGRNVGSTTTISPYPDVPASHWAAPYVEAAVNAGYVYGNVYGYFEPDRSITLQEGVTMAVRLLGYTDADFSGAWPTGQMALYHSEGLDRGISIGQAAPMTRQDALYLFYNLLTARTSRTGQAGGQIYLAHLGYPLTADEEIDRVALINAAMDGPVVVTGDWRSRLGFDVSTAAVYRGGKAAALSALQQNDVVYYSASMRILWAYSNKVTGLYQSVSPNPSSPTSVTVAGRTYPIETSEAAYALSNLGSYRAGDTVTLLLGRDGGVAAVATSAVTTGSIRGVVQQVSEQTYTDAGGSTYTAKTITLLATDGQSYSYPVGAKDSFKPGALVQVTTASGGQAQITRLSPSSVSGRVDTAAAKIGSTPLAQDVEILDSNSSGAAIKLYPSRLAGLTLDSRDVRYCRKNAAGEVDTLILNDATGDLYAYGILTRVSEGDYGTYIYDVAGQSYTYTFPNGVLNLTLGPVKVEGDLPAPEKLEKLSEVKLSSLDALTAVTQANASFPLADAVAVYELDNHEYRLSSVERVRTGYTLTGWYDRPAAQGGRIRVIIAKAQ